MSWTAGEFHSEVIYVNNNILQITNVGSGGGPVGNSAVYKLWDKNDVDFFQRKINSNYYIPRVENGSDVSFEPYILTTEEFNSVIIDFYAFFENEQSPGTPIPFLLERKIENGEWVDTGEVVFASAEGRHDHLQFVDVHSLDGETTVFYRFKNVSIESASGNYTAVMNIGYSAFCKIQEF